MARDAGRVEGVRRNAELAVPAGSLSVPSSSDPRDGELGRVDAAAASTRRWLFGPTGSFVAITTVVYIAATVLAALNLHLGQDRMMVLAEQVFRGRLDSPTFANTPDSVLIGGRYYLALGPLQLLPYLPFVPIASLHAPARYLVSLAFALPAAWMALPLARAYGGTGRSTAWVAAFVAFGTLLFYVGVFGDMYYLAHAEAFLALEAFLLEWAGRRRPVLLGVLLGASFLARPTTLLAAIPFGVALLWRRPSWARAATELAAPILLAGALYLAFNAIRFGSPLESGYGISTLVQPELIARRSLGIFSIAQMPENVRLFLLALPDLRGSFPFVVPDPYGMSMLLVSPALLLALRAGARDPLPRLLWAAAALVAIPVFLYYGGGYIQYGFRYSLDFTPFLVALVAMALARRFGRPEQALIVASIASVTFGVLWHARLL